MLGLLLIYFIGKKFYDLAGIYGKSQWGLAILSIVIYYATITLVQVGIILYLIDDIESMNNFVIALISLPFGLLAVVGLYKYLEDRFKKDTNVKGNSSEILDEGFF